MNTEQYDKLLTLYKRAARLTLNPEKVENEIQSTRLEIDKAFVLGVSTEELDAYLAELEYLLYEILPSQKSLK